MPVIKSAKKKLRKDKKREKLNDKVRTLLKKLIKKAKASLSDETIRKAVQTADKAAKNHIIHQNKASRIKSQLSKLPSKDKKTTEPTVKKTVSKSSPKAK